MKEDLQGLKIRKVDVSTDFCFLQTPLKNWPQRLDLSVSGGQRSLLSM